MSKYLKEIYVYLYDLKIGTLILHQGSIYFEYDKNFKNLNIEISPLKLPLKNKGLYTNYENKFLYAGLAGVFFDSLPDKFGMAFINRYFESKSLKSSEISLLDKLAFIGNRGMGAISYKPSEHDENKAYEDVLAAKDAYEDMKSILDSKDEIFSIRKLMNIVDSVSPLGGGRPKMLITYNESINKIKFNNKDLSANYKRAIIKFDEVYFEDESMDFTKIEYLYMIMAKECGINIPSIYLYKEDKQVHLIIQRFDRDENDEKIHICTASGLMHKDISIPQILSYEELFAFTSKICNKQTSIDELFRRMVFNILCFNYDDHAKNFTYIMYKNNNWDLSPAYDITYSKGLAKEHITSLNGKGKGFILEDFLQIAKKYSISQIKALKIIKTIALKLKEFPLRAIELNINDELIKECKEDIFLQLSLINE